VIRFYVSLYIILFATGGLNQYFGWGWDASSLISSTDLQLNAMEQSKAGADIITLLGSHHEKNIAADKNYAEALKQSA